jgi:KipI family sensor histidine kinase inhibitor
MSVSGRLRINPRFAPVGDYALSIEFDNVIDPEVSALVRALDLAIAASDIPGIVETVPSFRTLLIVYEPEDIGFDPLIQQLSQLISLGLNVRATRGRSWIVPVAYGFPDEADFRDIVAATRLTSEEIIAIHSSAVFQVYVVGFVPGLPVLGGLPAALHLSRRPDPRPDLPAGRVMIGGMQGIIVPMPMPSGYYSLGQTPLRPYQRGATNPFLFRPGDRIRFQPITPAELDVMAGTSSEHFLATGDE